ncbi:hypothetical protein [Phormidesmis priestleyi]|uniref:hypothetical protein n=1 Tax=Phormidesmis priestleyi TaxID=268141 RepID=UPI00083A8C81|nr:hypothetical protein [Phormidesmis priestleyi]
MNLLNVHPRYRPLASVLISAACIAPIAMELLTKQNADAQHKQATEQVEQAITRSSEQVARDERIALDRAKRCLIIDEKFPLVEGGNAYYDPRHRDSKRLLPANTALCSAQSGYTALVDESGTVSLIKQAPIEKLTPVLKQRGIK